MSQICLFPNFEPERVPETPVIVLGVKFQGFVDPETDQVVFSQSGVARALKVDEKTVRRWLKAKRFKQLRGGSSPRSKLLTEINNNPISVVTQADLVVLVRIASERGNAVAKSMQDASFAVLLQESVDKALGIERPRQEYLDKGASLRQRAEYLHQYHGLERTMFGNGHGVRGLTMYNSQVSSLAVPDADRRRALNPAWRQECDKEETMRLSICTAVHTKAAEASDNHQALKQNMGLAAQRSNDILDILDAPF